MVQVFCLLYVLFGIYLHYIGFFKNEKGREQFNKCSLAVKIIFTFYNIFFGPFIWIKAAISVLKER